MARSTNSRKPVSLDSQPFPKSQEDEKNDSSDVLSSIRHIVTGKTQSQQDAYAAGQKMGQQIQQSIQSGLAKQQSRQVQQTPVSTPSPSATPTYDAEAIAQEITRTQEKINGINRSYSYNHDERLKAQLPELEQQLETLRAQLAAGLPEETPHGTAMGTVYNPMANQPWKSLETTPYSVDPADTSLETKMADSEEFTNLLGTVLSQSESGSPVSQVGNAQRAMEILKKYNGENPVYATMVDKANTGDPLAIRQLAQSGVTYSSPNMKGKTEDSGNWFTDLFKVGNSAADNSGVFVDLVPDVSLEALRLARKNTSGEENVFFTNLYNQKRWAKAATDMANTQMPGTDHSVLEEMYEVAALKGGKEKESRKQAVGRQMMKLGIDTDEYAIYSGDGNFEINYFTDWLGQAAVTGLSDFSTGVWKTADALNPLKFFWEDNPISKGKRSAQDDNAARHYNTDLAAAQLGGGGWNFASAAVESTVAAVPDALLALATGGTSEATSSSLTNYALRQSGGALAKTGLTVEGMLKNPAYWTSFTREYGNDYEEALDTLSENGGTLTDTDYAIAALGSTVAALINSGIEIGFDGGSGIQGLPSDLAEDGGSKLTKWLVSSLEEGGEEWLQGDVNSLISYALYDSESPLQPLDESAKEALMGFVTGAVLGGGQLLTTGGTSGDGSSDVVDNVVRTDVLTDVNTPAAPNSNVDADLFANINPVTTTNTESTPSVTTDVTAESPVSPAADMADRLMPIQSAVQEYTQTGTVSNRMASIILSQSEAVSQLQSQTGVEITGTASQQRAAVKTAIARLAQTQAESRASTNVTPGTDTAATENFRAAAREVMGLAPETATQTQTRTETTAAPNQNLTKDEILALPPSELAAYVDSMPSAKYTAFARSLTDSEYNALMDTLEAAESNVQASETHPGEWSVGAANADFTGKAAYNELLSDENSQPDRPTDVRPMEVLETDPYGRKVTEFAANAYGAGVTTDAMADRIQELIMDGALGFDTRTNEESLTNAGKYIRENGVDHTHDQIISNIFGRGVVEDGDIEKAMLLYSEYNQDTSKRGQDNAAEMMVALSAMANKTGRDLQLFSMLRRMTPEGQLMTVEKTIQRQIDSMNRHRGKKHQIEDVSIPQELQQEYVDVARQNLNTQEMVSASAAEQIQTFTQELSADVADSAISNVVEDYIAEYNGDFADGESNANIQTNDLAEETGRRVAERLSRTAARQNTSIEEVLFQEIMRFANDKANYGNGQQTNARVQPTSNLDALRDYYRYRPFFQTAWDVARNRVEQNMQAMAEDDARIPILESFLKSGKPVLGSTTDYSNPKSTLRRGAKEAAMQAGIRMDNRTEQQATARRQMRDVLIENAANKQEAARQIARIATNDLDLTVDAAMDMANDIINAYYSDLADQSARRLKTMFGVRESTSKTAKSLAKRLEELFNIGAFDTDQYRRAAFDSIFGEGTNVDIPNSLMEQLTTANEKRRIEIEDAIYKTAASQIKATPKEKWDTWRYMCMLGNARTNVRNVLGNAMFVPYTEAKRVIGTAMEKVFLKKDQRTKSLLGLGENDQALLKWAKNDAKTTAAEALKYSSRLGDDNTYSKIQDSRAIFDSAFLEIARKVTEWAPAAGDMVFKNAEYSKSLAGFLKARGYSVADIEGGKVDSSVLNEARTYAIQEAMRSTFNDCNALSDFFANTLRFEGNNPVSIAANALLEGVLPFRRTPANIIYRATMEYSPVGILRGLVNTVTKVRSGEMSAATAIDQIAAGLTGSAAMALGYALAGGIGGIRLRGYLDDEDMERQGYQSYALEIETGGKVYSYDISWAAPANLPLFVGANLYQAFHDDTDDSDLSGFTKACYASINVLEPMLELSCLSSLNDLLESVRYAGEGETTYTVLAQAATSYFTQGIPTLVRQAYTASQPVKQQTFANSEDPLIRDLQRTAANIPFVGSAFKIDKIDERGNPVEQGNLASRIFNSFVNPGNLSVIEPDALEQEITRLNGVQESGVAPPTISKTITYTDANGNHHDKQRLTAEEYNTLRTVQGETSDRVLNSMIESEGYAALSDAQKAKAFEYTYDYAREVARTQAIDGYTGMASWMEGIEGNESGAIIQKVVGGDLQSAATAVTSAWRDGKDSANAMESMESNYRTYLSLPDDQRSAILENTTTAVKDYIQFREEGGTNEDYVAIYQPITLGKSAIDSAQEAFKDGSAPSNQTLSDMDSAYSQYSQASDDQKSAILEGSTKAEKALFAAKDAEISSETFLDLYRQYYTISHTDEKPAAQANTWAYTLQKAVEGGTLTQAQANVLKSSLTISSGFTQETKTYDKFLEAGVSADQAASLMGLLDGIEPEDGYTNVRPVQKVEEIATASGMTEKERVAVMKIYLSDSQDEALDRFLAVGYSAEVYSRVYRIYSDANHREAETIAALQEKFGCSLSEAIAVYDLIAGE